MSIWWTLRWRGLIWVNEVNDLWRDIVLTKFERSRELFDFIYIVCKHHDCKHHTCSTTGCWYRNWGAPWLQNITHAQRRDLVTGSKSDNLWRYWFYPPTQGVWMKITWNMHNRNDSGSIQWTITYYNRGIVLNQSAHELMLGPGCRMSWWNESLWRWNIPNLFSFNSCLHGLNKWMTFWWFQMLLFFTLIWRHDPIPDPSLLMYGKTHTLARGTITYGIFWIVITNKIYCKVNATKEYVVHFQSCFGDGSIMNI